MRRTNNVTSPQVDVLFVKSRRLVVKVVGLGQDLKSNPLERESSASAGGITFVTHNGRLTSERMS